MIGIGTEFDVGIHRYSILSELSRGGFGVAYLANRLDIPTQPPIVVKVPQAHVTGNPEWMRRFAREARVLANISHANIVKNIALCDIQDGVQGLAQEYIQDASGLISFLGASSNRNLDCCSLLLQACYGLQSFHSPLFEPAVVHRDISPSNILVTGDGLLKVIDFGLAKEDPRATEILTQTGQWFGTHGCMAPEQTVGAAHVDHRADIYAVGRSFAAGLQQRNPLHVEIHLLDEPWATILGRLAAHDVDARYQSISEARDAVLCYVGENGLVLPNYLHHASELKGEAPPGWARASRAYIDSIGDMDAQLLPVLATLSGDVFADPGFDAGRFFGELEASPLVHRFRSRVATFDDADLLGNIYAKLYLNLSAEERKACFRSLVTTAVDFHRYHVMGLVRSVYGGEPSPSVRAELATILDEVDRGAAIHGRGILPRTP